MSPAIDVGSIKEVDAQVKSSIKGVCGDLVIGRSIAHAVRIAADGPGAEANFGDLDACFAEVAILHFLRCQWVNVSGPSLFMNTSASGRKSVLQ
ncbi:MAG: hypothetical protein BWY75_02395 [bacterium ADurb.Bin425]|nr:MAG: hypothetical protein BWY75_02395 [bacterium ADurb.Bin425]